jgi:hypothetical protein
VVARQSMARPLSRWPKPIAAGANLKRAACCNFRPQFSSFEPWQPFTSRRPLTDPIEVLKRIRESCPRAGGKKLLDIFSAVVIENRHLHRAIIAQSFVRALEQLSATNAPPKP